MSNEEQLPVGQPIPVSVAAELDPEVKKFLDDIKVGKIRAQGGTVHGHALASAFGLGSRPDGHHDRNVAQALETALEEPDCKTSCECGACADSSFTRAPKYANATNHPKYKKR